MVYFLICCSVKRRCGFNCHFTEHLLYSHVRHHLFPLPCSPLVYSSIPPILLSYPILLSVCCDQLLYSPHLRYFYTCTFVWYPTNYMYLSVLSHQSISNVFCAVLLFLPPCPSTSPNLYSVFCCIVWIFHCCCPPLLFPSTLAIYDYPAAPPCCCNVLCPHLLLSPSVNASWLLTYCLCAVSAASLTVVAVSLLCLLCLAIYCLLPCHCHNLCLCVTPPSSHQQPLSPNVALLCCMMKYLKLLSTVQSSQRCRWTSKIICHQSWLRHGLLFIINYYLMLEALLLL